jgi:DmsE family decaheme c-type cytochrome
MRHPTLRLFRVVLVLMACARVADAQAQQTGAAKPPAGYAGSKECVQCHRVIATQFAATDKGKLFLDHPRNEHQALGCESCHGPTKEHAQSGGEERGGLISFSGKAVAPVAARNAVCLSCHQTTARTLWKGSPHESRNVACTDCHSVMHPETERGSLKKPTVLETCARCHQQRAAQQQRFSHMPLAQGKMECTSCHNPHGSPNDKLLLASSTNATCFTCHADKRGPFLWEHAPVVENCANCHDPHGSNKEKMLKEARPRLCQQCHAGTGHPTQPRIVGRQADLPFVFNRACSNCHFNIHGSNHPAGAFFTR